MQAWFVYLLECRGGSLYTGVTNDVAKRFAAHQAGKGAKYTRAHPPEKIALKLTCANRRVAQQLEYAIKQLSAPEKRQLIAGDYSRLHNTAVLDSNGIWLEAFNDNACSDIPC